MPDLQVRDLRSLTTKLFVQMVNMLFTDLGIYNKDEPVQVTPNTLENDLPHWLKVIEYPGVVNKSWLKTGLCTYLFIIPQSTQHKI